MKLNKKIIITALILSAVTTYGIYRYIVSFRDNTNVIAVWAAKKEIAEGTKIDNSMIEKQQVKEAYVLGNTIKNKDDIIGKYADVKILKNEQITSQRILNVNQSGFAYKIPIDKRAVTVEVDPVAGVANIINTGDFIDVLLFIPKYELEEKNFKIQYPPIDKIVLQNIQVLAVDKNPLSKSNDDSSKKASSNDEKNKITIAVSAKESEEIALAENIGKIKLSLRNPQDKSTYNSGGVIRNDIMPEKGKKIVNR